MDCWDRLCFRLFLMGLIPFLLVLILGLVNARTMTDLGALMTLSLFPVMFMAAFASGAWRWWSRKKNPVDGEQEAP